MVVMDTRQVFECLNNKVKAINGKTIVRHNMDTALNYQVYYGELLISFRFAGVFSVTDDMKLSIRIVDMETVTTLGQDIIDVKGSTEEITDKLINYLIEKGLKVEFNS